MLVTHYCLSRKTSLTALLSLNQPLLLVSHGAVDDYVQEHLLIIWTAEAQHEVVVLCPHNNWQVYHVDWSWTPCPSALGLRWCVTFKLVWNQIVTWHNYQYKCKNFWSVSVHKNFIDSKWKPGVPEGGESAVGVKTFDLTIKSKISRTRSSDIQLPEASLSGRQCRATSNQTVILDMDVHLIKQHQWDHVH